MMRGFGYLVLPVSPHRMASGQQETYFFSRIGQDQIPLDIPLIVCFYSMYSMNRHVTRQISKCHYRLVCYRISSLRPLQTAHPLGWILVVLFSTLY